MMMYSRDRDGIDVGRGEPDRFNRRRFLQGAGGALFLTLGGGALVGCGGGQTTQSQGGAGGSPKKGGTLEVAINADPPTLDWTSSTATATRNIAWHVFEQPFSFDHDYKVRPMLAESYEVSGDKKTYTIKLRQGIQFHDGSPMVAEDVVASIERWGALSGGGAATLEGIKDIRAADDSTVEIELKDVFVPLIANLADPKQALVVIPAKIAKSAGIEPLGDDQLIGTGPYQFDSWERGKKVTLSRFDDYASRSEDWGGLTGKKETFLDTLNFSLVTDTQVRLNGLQTEQYHYALDLSQDLYEQIKTFPNVEPELISPEAWLAVVPNKARPPFDDVRMRQALNYALDKEEIARAAYGDPRFFQLDGSIFFPDQGDLYTTKGTKGFKTHDPARAKQLMKEAGYDGKPIRYMVTSDYPDHFNAAQVVVQQLKSAGFNIDLQVLDWPTLQENRENKDAQEMYTTSFSPSFDPSVVIWLDPEYAGWYESERMQSLLDEWVRTSDDAKKQQLLADINRTVYEEVPLAKIVNSVGLQGRVSKLLGYENWMDMKFWNTGFSSPPS